MESFQQPGPIVPFIGVEEPFGASSSIYGAMGPDCWPHYN